MTISEEDTEEMIKRAVNRVEAIRECQALMRNSRTADEYVRGVKILWKMELERRAGK